MFETVVLLLVLCVPESSGRQGDARAVSSWMPGTQPQWIKLLLSECFTLFLDVIGDFVVHVRTHTHTIGVQCYIIQWINFTYIDHWNWNSYELIFYTDIYISSPSRDTVSALSQNWEKRLSAASCLSVCLSVRPSACNNSALWTDYRDIWYLCIFRISV